ncbi:MAG: hypothetical protein JRK26_06355 [Deltaproteobacteria bacterium]|nr:hypothetical protein [Deltaproteobacteria bacterium]
MKKLPLFLLLLVCLLCCGKKKAVEELSPGHTVTIQAGDIKAVFADNTEFGVHRAWYNGVAFLSHKADTVNIFRPRVAGLNFEHIFDGQKWWEPAEVLFEPRACPMSIQRISDRTAELHQGPTSLHKLESWTRFTVTDPHYIDMEFTCIPRAETFDRGYIGLFWASYINTKVDKGYYFIGRKTVEDQKQWVEINSPAHNIESSVRYELDERDPGFVEGYPPRLFNNYMDYRYSYPFYYGRRGKMAWMLMFEQAGPVRFSHSPTSGAPVGPGTEPAWDFHYLFYDYKVGEKYGFKARLVYKPFVSREDIIEEYENWSGEKVEMP